MNILLLSQFFSETRGGGEYVFKLLANSLAKNNNKVWIITNKITGEDYNFHNNVKTIFVKPDLEFRGGLPPGIIDNIRYTSNAIKVGMQIIKKENIDLIHSNNFAPALAGAILSLFTSKPHITTILDIFSLCGQDYWKRWIEQSGVSKIHAFLGPRFEKMILKFPLTAIHTISEATKNDLIKFGAKKPIHVILPSITRTDQKSINVNSSQFVYVGRLVFYKNLEVIIKAISIARKNEPQIKLVIVGEGPHRQTLEELTKTLGLEQNIEFMGYVNADKKTRLLATSCALVFPSLCEGFGLVILEAFDQSKPVLVSNIRPMSDIVSHGENGFVLDPHNENQWADCFLRIIKNSQEASEMGKNGNKLLTMYGQESMYQKIIKMYSDIIKEHA